jgi:hypothetical protein
MYRRNDIFIEERSQRNIEETNSGCSNNFENAWMRKGNEFLFIDISGNFIGNLITRRIVEFNMRITLYSLDEL